MPDGRGCGIECPYAWPQQVERQIREESETWRGKHAEALSFSVGRVAAAEFPGSDLYMLVREADKRMYEDKERYYSVPEHDRRK